MRAEYSPRFQIRLLRFSVSVGKKFKKQLDFLLSDLRHPSLHAKKYDEAEGVWQARVDDSIRFYFVIRNDIYILLDIRKHSD